MVKRKRKRGTKEKDREGGGEVVDGLLEISWKLQIGKGGGKVVDGLIERR